MNWPFRSLHLHFTDHFGDRVRVRLSNGSLSFETLAEGDGYDPEWLDLSVDTEVYRYEERRGEMYSSLMLHIAHFVCLLMVRSNEQA